MQAAGNFTRLQRARQQSFYADAAAQWAAAQHEVTASREALVRLLGLTDAQATRLTLPERLPDLPKAPRSPEEVSQTASAARLDLRTARAALDALVAERGLRHIASFTDIELGIRRDTRFDTHSGSS